MSMSRDIPLATIQPNPHQPRRRFDQDRLRELADSMQLHGLASPITVRPVGELLEIVAGASAEQIRIPVRELVALRSMLPAGATDDEILTQIRHLVAATLASKPSQAGGARHGR